jgi:hypothetical protein
MNNVIDSVEDNEALVVIWNAVMEKTEDREIFNYARSKVKQLIDLREAKRISDNNKKDFDKSYVRLINREMMEVKRYA